MIVAVHMCTISIPVSHLADTFIQSHLCGTYELAELLSGVNIFLIFLYFRKLEALLARLVLVSVQMTHSVLQLPLDLTLPAVFN